MSNVSNETDVKLYISQRCMQDVLDKYTAVIQMVDSKDVLKVDQDHVETVLPALGKSLIFDT